MSSSKTCVIHLPSQQNDSCCSLSSKKDLPPPYYASVDKKKDTFGQRRETIAFFLSLATFLLALLFLLTTHRNPSESSVNGLFVSPSLDSPASSSTVAPLVQIELNEDVDRIETTIYANSEGQPVVEIHITQNETSNEESQVQQSEETKENEGSTKDNDCSEGVPDESSDSPAVAADDQVDCAKETDSDEEVIETVIVIRPLQPGRYARAYLSDYA